MLRMLSRTSERERHGPREARRSEVMRLASVDVNLSVEPNAV